VLTAGSILLLAVHFIAVDVAMAAPLACIWLARRSLRRGDALAGLLDVQMARASLLALVVGIAVGSLQLAIIYLTGDHDFWRAAAAVAPDRLWFSLAELVFFALCMTGYLWLAGRPIRRPKLAAALALLASLDLMAHFPPLFTMLNLLADRPSLFGQKLDSPLYRSLLADPEVLSMVLHVYLAAIAVTAVLVMYRAAAVSGRASAPAGQGDAPPAVLLGGARAAFLTTSLQMAVGIWVLVSVPNRLRYALMGEDLLATIPFALGILTTLGLLQHLSAIALGDRDPRQIRRSVVLMLSTVLFMTATLHRVRQLGRPTAEPASVEARLS
jgi:hypothetical protein